MTAAPAQQHHDLPVDQPRACWSISTPSTAPNSRSRADGAGGAPDTIGELLVAALGAGHADDLVGYAQGVEIGTDALINVQNATGGSGDDTLIGNDDANILDGAEGADTITGNGGDDTIVYVAGDGTDISLDGGADVTDDTLAITGTDGEDTIKVVVSTGTVVKLTSNDDIHGGSNNVANIELVTLDLGQGGDDTLDYSGTGADDDVTVNLVTGSADRLHVAGDGRGQRHRRGRRRHAHRQ